MCELCNCTIEQKRQAVADAISIGYSVKYKGLDFAGKFCEDSCRLMYGDTALAKMCFAMCVYGYNQIVDAESLKTDEDYLQLWDTCYDYMVEVNLVVKLE